MRKNGSVFRAKIMESRCKTIVYGSNLGNVLKAKSVLTTAHKIWREYFGVEVKFNIYYLVGGM
jgi:hypothetical protein